jgi:uncharacterized protein (DUF1330 family)
LSPPRAVPCACPLPIKEVKMSAYIVVQVVVHNPEAYEEYRKRVPAILALYDGKFLVRGGKVETLEGDWLPQRFVLLEFPTVERAKEWHASPEYQAIVGIRYANSDGQMIVVQGV